MAGQRRFIDGSQLTPADIIQTVKWLERCRRKMDCREASDIWNDIIAGKFIPFFCARDDVLCGIICFSLKGDVANCEVVAGENFLDIFDFVDNANWDEFGVKKLVFEGRTGWLGRADKHGWRQTKIYMEKKIG